MVNVKKIILIAYKFPPFAGVGALRWSKLTKYLSEMGFVIHVFTIDWTTSLGEHTYSDDVKHKNIIIHRIPSGYFKVLNPGKNRYINKLKYYLRQFAYYDDEAQRWGPHLIPAVETLMKKEAINTVIATGHPFQAIRWATEIKKRQPHIRLIQDYRDPWVSNSNKPVSWWFKSTLDHYQSEALDHADQIVCVTDGLAKEYQKFTKNKHITVIRNAIDSSGLTIDHNVKKQYTFIYIGNITNQRQQPFNNFLSWFSSACKQDSSLTLLLIGEKLGDLTDHEDLIESGRIICKSAMKQVEAFNHLQQSKYALQVGAEIYPYALSTKIFEHAYFNVPTISLNYGGDIEELIEKHKLGYSINLKHLNKDAIYQYLYDIFNNRRNDLEITFNIEGFTYKEVAEQYANVIVNGDTNDK